MPEPKAQLVDPQGPIDVPGLSVTGVTTATGGFVGQVQGTATGFAATTYNLNVGIVTATKFQGNTTGNVSGLADDTNINVGIITSTSFTGDLVGNAAGLSTTTANIKAGIMSATSFAGNFTGVASGITGTPNIVVGIMTGTLNGDGSALTGIAATNWITNNVTANSSTTTVNLSLGNVVKFTQTSNTTVSFANTGTSNIVTFIRPAADYTLTWPSAIKWDGGAAPTLDTSGGNDINVITLLTRDEGVTWYGWETVNQDISGQLFIWGQNDRGQLAQNDVVLRSSPVQIPGRWSTAFSGKWSYLGTKTDGTLWGWGQNDAGQLGQNNETSYSSPVQIPGTTWKNSSSRTISTGSAAHAGAIKTDGTLWVWGTNDYGNGTNNTTQRSSPVQVPGTSWATINVGASNCGAAVRTDGTAWMWGYNEYGNLGLSTQIEYSSPVQLPGTNWDYIKFGSNQGISTFGIKTDGTLWSWGVGYYGMLGNNQGPVAYYSSPTQIPGTSWKSFSNSQTESAATRTDGTLWTWGKNDYGQLGQNDKTQRSSPVQVPGTNWDVVIAGRLGFNAIKTDGTIWGWGQGNYGGLGQNDVASRSSPVQVPGTWAKALQAGWNNNMAVK